MAATSSVPLTATKRHSLRLRNQVSCRLANWRVSGFDQGNRLVERQPAGQVLADFTITHGLRGRASPGLTGGIQPLDFFDQPGGKHRVDAAIDALVQFGSRPIEHEHAAGTGRPRQVELLLPVANRPTGLFKHFDSPDNPPLVGGR